MTYFDANIFVFAACDQTEIGSNARVLINDIQEGRRTVSTSALTYDEVVWGVRKSLGKEAADRAGELFLALPHLQLIEVKRETITEAHHLVKHFNLKPRDAIHFATMRLERETEIVSEDPDFDALPGIKRIALREVNFPRKD